MEILQIDKKWSPVAKRLGITEAFAVRLNGQISRLYTLNPDDSYLLIDSRQRLQSGFNRLNMEKLLQEGPQLIAPLTGLVLKINTDVSLLKSVFDSSRSHADVLRAIDSYTVFCRKQANDCLQDQWIRSSQIEDPYSRLTVQNALAKVDFGEFNAVTDKLKKGVRASVLNIRHLTRAKIKAIRKMIE